MQEALNMSKDRVWSSFMCILAVSSVLNKIISCNYPDSGLVKYRQLMHRSVMSRSGSALITFEVLYCSEGSPVYDKPF